MEKLKAAIIGLGKMGAEPSSRFGDPAKSAKLPVSHAESMLATEQLEIVAGCDPDEERRKRHGDYYNIQHLYTDYKAMLSEVKPDFLSIATRTHGRPEIIKDACESGVKMLYFEKPISTNMRECRMALQAAEENNVIVGYGTSRRYHSVYRKAKEMLMSGEFGELRQITVEFNRGNLLWTHPHCTDIILYFAGTTELEYMQGSCSFQGDYKPEDMMLIDDDPIIDNAFFKFTNGIQATITQIGGSNIRLGCTEGIITIYSNGQTIEARKGGKFFTDTVVEKQELTVSPTVTVFNEMLDVYHGKSTVPPITTKDIETGLLMLYGVLHSSLSGGKRISPGDVPEDMVVTGRSGTLYA